MLVNATQSPADPTNKMIAPNLQRLIDTLLRSPLLTPAQVKDLVIDCQIDSQSLLPWADFEHPVTDSYGRQLVFYGGHFEVMVMSWLPGDFSAIHDHGLTQWGAVQCFGAAEHYIYRFSDGKLKTLDPAPYTSGMVRAVDHRLIHQMGNSSNQPFLSLHVYGCPNPAETITGNARIFDLWENSIQYTDGGVFFCLPESEIQQKDYGLVADKTTTLRHHQQMANRISRMLQSQHDEQLNQTLLSLQAELERLRRCV